MDVKRAFNHVSRTCLSRTIENKGTDKDLK